MFFLGVRPFRLAVLLCLGLTGCTSNRLVYSEGDPPIIGDACRVKRIKYADNVQIACRDHSIYKGRFMGTDCRHGSETLLLSRNPSRPGSQDPDTQRVAVSSITEIRRAKADYASSGAAVILGFVGVALIVGLAGGGGWLTIPD
jgi:hypothetical protein